VQSKREVGSFPGVTIQTRGNTYARSMCGGSLTLSCSGVLSVSYRSNPAYLGKFMVDFHETKHTNLIDSVLVSLMSSFRAIGSVLVELWDYSSHGLCSIS
jgi:hypothetical protein